MTKKNSSKLYLHWEHVQILLVLKSLNVKLNINYSRLEEKILSHIFIELYFLTKKWADFLREVDPDIITGYNIQNFDFAYLLARAQHLNIHSFPYLGRLKV